MSTSEQPQPSWDDLMLDITNASGTITASASASAIDFSDPSESIFQAWQQENDQGQMHEDDDVIMQLDADEGLLNLNDFYDSISADTSPPEQLLADAVLPIDSDSDANSFFSCDEVQLEHQHQQPHQEQHQHHFPHALPQMSSIELQESMEKLTKSMQKSKATRQSLYAQTPKLKDYQRSGTVENVVRRIEYSSRQIDTYYSSIHSNILV
jgi:hypothetical protein